MRIGLILGLLVVAACPADGAEDDGGSGGFQPLDCASAATQEACSATRPSNGGSEHQCLWVEVRTVDASCSAAPADAGGRCIRTEFQGDGCNGGQCNDGTDRLFWREADDGFEVFESSVCGDEPVGFSPCMFDDGDSVACGCLCDELGGRAEEAGGSSSGTD